MIKEPTNARTIESIDYIVRQWRDGYCIIESMTLSDRTLHQRGIVYGVTQANAYDMADAFQASFESFGYRPTTK